MKDLSGELRPPDRTRAILKRSSSRSALIAWYIYLFQWKFAVPVLAALAHDVLITIGIYALLGRR